MFNDVIFSIDRIVFLIYNFYRINFQYLQIYVSVNLTYLFNQDIAIGIDVLIKLARYLV